MREGRIKYYRLAPASGLCSAVQEESEILLNLYFLGYHCENTLFEGLTIICCSYDIDEVISVGVLFFFPS